MPIRGLLLQLLWAGPRLALMALGAFILLTSLPELRPLSSPVGDPLDRTSASLPRFVNTSPRDVRERVQEALQQLQTEGPRALQGGKTLARLGGAALPYVVRELDGLPPEARSRTALALGPIARRMGMNDPASDDPVRAATFWRQAWEARGVEFRPAQVRSARNRLLRFRSESRSEQLRAFDTYALEFLFESLTPPRDELSLDEARVLVDAISRVAERDDRIAPHASLASARACVERWQRWWTTEGLQFVALDGSGRLVAAFLETRFGHAVRATLRQPLGADRHGSSLSDELTRSAAYTVSLLLLALCLTTLTATALSAFSQSVAHNRAIALIAMSTIALLAWPPLGWQLMHRSSSTSSVWGYSSLVLVLFLSRLGNHTLALQSWGSTLSNGAQSIGLLARGRSGSRPLFRRNLERSFKASLARLPIELPLTLGVAIILEAQVNVPGLGRYFVQALRDGDALLIATVSLIAATMTTLCSSVGDWLLEWLNPRFDFSHRRDTRA